MIMATDYHIECNLLRENKEFKKEEEEEEENKKKV